MNHRGDHFGRGVCTAVSYPHVTRISGFGHVSPYPGSAPDDFFEFVYDEQCEGCKCQDGHTARIVIAGHDGEDASATRLLMRHGRAL